MHARSTPVGSVLPASFVHIIPDRSFHFHMPIDGRAERFRAYLVTFNGLLAEIIV